MNKVQKRHISALEITEYFPGLLLQAAFVSDSYCCLYCSDTSPPDSFLYGGGDCEIGHGGFLFCFERGILGLCFRHRPENQSLDNGSFEKPFFYMIIHAGVNSVCAISKLFNKR